MGVIAVSDERDEIWCVAGWAFRQVLDDAASQYPDDSEMAAAFAMAKTQSGLHIDTLPAALADRVTAAIRQVTTGILSGAVRSGILDQPYGDAATVEQYRVGLRELLETLPPDTKEAGPDHRRVTK
jgi:hypothetical protein